MFYAGRNALASSCPYAFASKMHKSSKSHNSLVNASSHSAIHISEFLSKEQRPEGSQSPNLLLVVRDSMRNDRNTFNFTTRKDCALVLRTSMVAMNIIEQIYPTSGGEDTSPLWKQFADKW